VKVYEIHHVVYVSAYVIPTRLVNMKTKRPHKKSLRVA